MRQLLPRRATRVHNAVVSSTSPLRTPSEVAFHRAFCAVWGVCVCVCVYLTF